MKRKIIYASDEARAAKQQRIAGSESVMAAIASFPASELGGYEATFKEDIDDDGYRGSLYDVWFVSCDGSDEDAGVECIIWEDGSSQVE